MPKSPASGLQLETYFRCGISADDARALEEEHPGPAYPGDPGPEPEAIPEPVASGTWRASVEDLHEALAQIAGPLELLEEPPSTIAPARPSRRRWLLVGPSREPDGTPSLASSRYAERGRAEVIASKGPGGLFVKIGRYEPSPADVDQLVAGLVKRGLEVEEPPAAAPTLGPTAPKSNAVTLRNADICAVARAIQGEAGGKLTLQDLANSDGLQARGRDANIGASTLVKILREGNVPHRTSPGRPRKS